jgi:hypothetical protein
MSSKSARRAKREAAQLRRQQKAEFVGVDLPDDAFKIIVAYAVADRAETALALRATSKSTANFVAAGLAGLEKLNLSLRSKVAYWLLLLPSICDDEHVGDEEQVTICVPQRSDPCLKKKKPQILQLSRGRKFGCRTWLLLPPSQHVDANGTARASLYVDENGTLKQTASTLDTSLVDGLIKATAAMGGRAEFWRRPGNQQDPASRYTLIEELRLRPKQGGKLLLHAHSARASLHTAASVGLTLTFHGDDPYIQALFSMTADALKRLAEEEGTTTAKIRVLVPASAPEAHGLFSLQGQAMGQRACRNFIWPMPTL